MDILKTLDGMFQPKSIAVIGASNKEGKIGHSVMKNLVVDSKYAGPVYPINPKDKEVLGKKAYTSILDVPGDVDAAVIIVPSKFALQVTKECGEKGVKGLIVIASGFSEAGKQQLELDMVSLAHEYGMKVLGPNIVGVLSNANNMNASFAPCLPMPGGAALVSQSGALLIAMDTATYTRRVGFDKLISIGNMSDVDFGDCVSWLDADENTSAISLYIEGNRDGRKFMKAAQKAKKPIIALKSGISEHGAAAAASHTGSLAGAAKVYSAAFQQAGVVQASDLNNLFDRTLALTLQPPLKGDNLLIITNGGGVGVLATDAAERYGIPLTFAPEDVQAELKKHMPEFGSAKNPVDVTGMAGTEWYVESCGYAITHPWVDGLVVLYCETAVTDPMDIAKGVKKAVDDAGIKASLLRYPLLVVNAPKQLSSGSSKMVFPRTMPLIQRLTPWQPCVNSQRSKKMLLPQQNISIAANREAALKIIEGARADGRDSLTEVEAKLVFKAYGMPVTLNILSTSEDEAIKLANQIGYPVVMKIVSPDILHKSDAGGVKVNVKDDAGVREAYQTILSNAKAYKADADIQGVVIQEMAPWGTEVILGSVNDPTFGPTMMFGLGGIFVEVLKDVTFRVAPVSDRQAKKMITEINGAPILEVCVVKLPVTVKSCSTRL